MYLMARRHVCTNQRNTTYPVRTKHVFCKPTYKKYMVRCGTQWCEGVRLVYEKYHKEGVADSNHTVVEYSCCPGWTQVTYRSHGCNKPVCTKPCINGGKCVKPNVCSCPPGYQGTYCETTTRVYTPTDCSPACENGGTCSPKTLCICPPGFTGDQCEKDVDECKEKPCDQICYNTPGSFKCECKETFILQKDGQTCRKEDDEGTPYEAKDLESQQRLDKMDKRLQKLEKMVREKSKNEVSKKDLHGIYGNIDKISNDISVIANKIQRLASYSEEINTLSCRIDCVDKRTEHCAINPCPHPCPEKETCCCKKTETVPDNHTKESSHSLRRRNDPPYMSSDAIRSCKESPSVSNQWLRICTDPPHLSSDSLHRCDVPPQMSSSSLRKSNHPPNMSSNSLHRLHRCDEQRKLSSHQPLKSKRKNPPHTSGDSSNKSSHSTLNSHELLHTSYHSSHISNEPAHISGHE